MAETQARAIAPLLGLRNAGKIALKPFDFAALHRCSTQMFVLAGRYDEAVDYRTSIALAIEYPKHVLFIANDNHVFSSLASSGTSKKLIASFFQGGLGSTQFAAALSGADRYRWMDR